MLNKHGEELCAVEFSTSAALPAAAHAAMTRLVQEAEYATTDVDNWDKVTITLDRDAVLKLGNTMRSIPI